jgi:hypothetical protein
MLRDQILDDAKALIGGDRATQYGDSYDTHRRVGEAWSAILNVQTISPGQVALMMIALKSIRASKNIGYLDSWVDICGYAALGGEMST